MLAPIVCRGSSPLFPDVRCVCVCMPSIVSAAYSRCSPLVFVTAALAFCTRRGELESTLLLAVVVGAKNGNTSLRASYLECAFDSLVVSLPFGAVSIPRSPSLGHILLSGVVSCLACHTDDKMLCLSGV